MRRILWLLPVLLLAFTPYLYPQGITTPAAKEDWEEINFEFNSSVLVDGYPSLLRLAGLLQKHPDYRVRVEGHTDIVGSDKYNQKLAVTRSETVKSFLVKYGVRPDQVEVMGRGKKLPKVDNRTKEGRFMNRRVVLTLTDAQGNVVSDGSVGDAINALSEIAKKQEDCCNAILKKLDKLDEILALLRDLKGENDRLKRDVAGLRAGQSGLKKDVDQMASAPKVEFPKVAEIVKAVEEARPKTQKFSVLGMNLGPDMTGNVTFTGKGRFFSPFNSSQALQVEGEYMYYRDRQEGQFDFGLVNRYRNVQAGLFSSFKHVSMRDMQQGGTLGQAAMTFDYLFRGGRIGLFGTKGFLNEAVINRAYTTASRNILEETYLKVVDQLGGSTQVGLWKDSYLEGNLGAMFRHGGGNRPGGMVRLVQPVNPHVAFTLEAGLNETLIGSSDSGRVVAGVQFGNFGRPKEYRDMKQPVPVDIPRLRYEMLTRRVRTGNDPPVADAGPDQIGASAGTITLDGSASYDPDGDEITFAWAQIGGQSVSITGMTSAKATFTAAAGQTYQFRLTVKDTQGAKSVARVTITTQAAPSVKIVRFEATPSTVKAGQSTTIVWEVQDADEVSITGIGKVDPRTGTSTLAINETTVYQLTAKNKNSEQSKTLTVTVERSEARILRFSATPANIAKGEASTLAWETENADTVEIAGIGTVQRSGTAPVSPTETASYKITARNRFGEVNATATVTVAPGLAPRIIRFASTPVEILPTEQASLVWQVENATEVTISGIGKVEPVGTSTVSPKENTSYTITAKNALGEVSAVAVVGVIVPVKILDFVASPTSSNKPGDPVQLTWSTTNATEVIITGVGPVAANGSMTVNPSSDVSYSLIAYGKRTQATAIVIVRVGSASSANRAPVADAGPNQTTTQTQIALNGSGSYDPDGDPITYSWRVSGAKPAEITGGNTATPTVRFQQGWGDYIFELTVTDNKGARSSASTVVNYIDP
jgi:uncharacterized cupredoxin-like copper-binding protein